MLTFVLARLSCLWNDVMAATLKALYETENKTTSIDLSLREEQSCQISSWYDLKWQSLKLFLKRSTTTWVQYEIRLDLKIQQMYSQSKISFPDMCKLDKRTFFCSAASDFSSFLAWLCAHFRSSRVLVSWCSSCLNSSFLSSHNFTNSSNFLHKTHNTLRTLHCTPYTVYCTLRTLQATLYSVKYAVYTYRTLGVHQSRFVELYFKAPKSEKQLKKLNSASGSVVTNSPSNYLNSIGNSVTFSLFKIVFQ